MPPVSALPRVGESSSLSDLHADRSWANITMRPYAKSAYDHRCIGAAFLAVQVIVGLMIGRNVRTMSRLLPYHRRFAPFDYVAVTPLALFGGLSRMLMPKVQRVLSVVATILLLVSQRLYFLSTSAERVTAPSSCQA